MSSSQEEHDVSHSKSKRFVDSILKKKKKVNSGKPKHIGDDEIEKMLRSDVTCDEADVSLVEETNTEKPDEQDLNASNFFESTVSSEVVPPVENLVGKTIPQPSSSKANSTNVTSHTDDRNEKETGEQEIPQSRFPIPLILTLTLTINLIF